MVNEEFFRNAPRDGEIEIRVKNPPEGFDYEAYQKRAERSLPKHEKRRHEGSDQEQQAPIREQQGPSSNQRKSSTTSSAKKILQGERPDPHESRQDFLRGEEAREALYNLPPENAETVSYRDRAASPYKSRLEDGEEEEKTGQLRGRERNQQESPQKSAHSSGKKKQGV